MSAETVSLPHRAYLRAKLEESVQELNEASAMLYCREPSIAESISVALQLVRAAFRIECALEVMKEGENDGKG